MIKKEGDLINGRYEIMVIFEGGMGIIYPCIDKVTEKMCVLKTFKIDESELLDVLNRETMKEALAWLKLDKHQNIIRAYGFDFLENKPYIFIEMVVPDENGKHNLEDYLKDKLSDKQILEWAIQFCHGMEHAVNNGVTPHRDIKPTNILITQDKILKITDFGLAKLWEDIDLSPIEDKLSKQTLDFLQITHSGGGTLPWMAPEQYDGFADQRSDIYSFGIVLYQMVNKGKLPFFPKLDTFEDWRFAHKNFEMETIETDFLQIIEKCLNKDPEDRYNNFEELRIDLEDLYKKISGEIPPKPIEGSELDSVEYNNKAMSYYKLGLKKEAITLLEKSLEKNPDNGVALNNMANIFFNDEKYDDAFKYSTNAISAQPDNAESWNLRAGLYKEKNDFENSLLCIDKSIELEPTNERYHLNKGVILRYDGKYAESFDCFKQALKINENYGEAHYQLGIVLMKLGNSDKANMEYKIALRLNPDYVKIEDGKNKIKGFGDI